MSSVKSASAAGLAALLATLAVVSCSSSKNGTEQTSGPAAGSVSAPPTRQSAPTTPDGGASSPSAAGSLTGNWSGNYSGSFHGTFTLHWTQTGSKLDGTINLSTAGTVPLHGTMSNNRINFGTVGSTVITYTGSVSGDAMSGTYQIAGGAGGGGPWSAHRS
jgi:hypothetical protein